MTQTGPNATSSIGSRAADGALPTIEGTDFYGSQLF
jgi:hypothetical protein